MGLLSHQRAYLAWAPRKASRLVLKVKAHICTFSVLKKHLIILVKWEKLPTLVQLLLQINSLVMCVLGVVGSWVSGVCYIRIFTTLRRRYVGPFSNRNLHWTNFWSGKLDSRPLSILYIHAVPSGVGAAKRTFWRHHSCFSARFARLLPTTRRVSTLSHRM